MTGLINSHSSCSELLHLFARFILFCCLRSELSLLCHQAFSAFFYIHSFLERITGVTVSTPSQMEQAAKAVCGTTLNEVMFVIVL